MYNQEVCFYSWEVSVPKKETNRMKRVLNTDRASSVSYLLTTYLPTYLFNYHSRVL